MWHFDPNEPRGFHGRWGAGSSGSALARAITDHGSVGVGKSTGLTIAPGVNAQGKARVVVKGAGTTSYHRSASDAAKTALDRSAASTHANSLGGKTSFASADSATPTVKGGKIAEADLAKSVGTGAWTKNVRGAVTAIQNGNAIDTEQAYRQPNPDGTMGPYSPARNALHERILSLLLQGAGTHGNDAQAIFMAGGPASGKSTLIRKGVVKVPADAVIANPDVIKEMLPEYDKLKGNPKWAAQLHEESSYLAKMATNIALQRNHHLIIDSVGDSQPGKFADKVRAAIREGHKVSVNYATIPTPLALKRNEARASHQAKPGVAGRRPPDSYVKAAHAAVSARFTAEVAKVDGATVRVFDNSGSTPKLIFSKPADQPAVVVDRPAYNGFVSKAAGTL